MVIYGEKRAVSYPGYVVYKIYDSTGSNNSIDIHFNTIRQGGFVRNNLHVSLRSASRHWTDGEFPITTCVQEYGRHFPVRISKEIEMERRSEEHEME